MAPGDYTYYINTRLFMAELEEILSEGLELWLNIDYWFDDYFIGYREDIPSVTDTSEYLKIVERSFKTSQRQEDLRIFGKSDITYQGRPTYLSPGDVINMPYKPTQSSPMQALGNAWVTASGRR